MVMGFDPSMVYTTGKTRLGRPKHGLDNWDNHPDLWDTYVGGPADGRECVGVPRIDGPPWWASLIELDWKGGPVS